MLTTQRIILAILLLCGTAFPAEFVNDQFTGTDGMDITAHTVDSGGTLTKTLGLSGKIYANRARSITSAVSMYAYSESLPDPEFDVEFQITRLSTSAADPIGAGWIDPVTNNGYVLVARPQQSFIRFIRLTGGAETTLATYILPGGFPVGDIRLKVEFRATGKTGYLDTGSGYVQRLATADNTHATPGKVGFWMGGPGPVLTGQHLDWLTGSTAAPPQFQSGDASLVAASDTSITVQANPAQWGVEPYSYQWHRGTTSGFALTGMTTVSGATDLILPDSPRLPGLYFYRLAVTDSESSMAYSNQVAGALWSPPLRLGFIGDSITWDGNTSKSWPQETASRLSVRPIRSAVAVNWGLGGTQTTSWGPTGASYIAAAAAFNSAGVTHTFIMLGANDCKAGVPAETYGNNIESIVNAELAAGRKVILSYPTGFTVGVTNGFDEAALERLASYFAELDALANGTTVLAGPREQFALFATTPALLKADGVHPNETGSARLASIFHSWCVEAGL